MEWYSYIACFFAGAFLANAVPHYVNGISGNKFPTPFAKPPGKGLSPPTLNVLWGFFNLGVGYLLCYLGHVGRTQTITIALVALGAILMSVMISMSFKQKNKE